jgi:hypothetical protein
MDADGNWDLSVTDNWIPVNWDEEANPDGL